MMEVDGPAFEELLQTVPFEDLILSLSDPELGQNPGNQVMIMAEINNRLQIPGPDGDVFTFSLTERKTLSRFVRMLSDKNTRIQLEAIKTLRRISYGEHSHIVSLVESSAISNCVTLLSSNVPEIRSAATRILGYIALSTPEYRNEVLYGGALKRLTRAIQDDALPDPKELRGAVWTIGNCLQGDHLLWNSVSPIIDIIPKLLFSEDEFAIKEACRMITTLIPVSNHEAFFTDEVCEQLVDLQLHPSVDVQIRALEAISQVVLAQFEDMIEAGVLQCLHSVLPSPCSSVGEAALDVLSIIQPFLDDTQSEEFLPVVVNMAPSGTARFRAAASQVLLTAVQRTDYHDPYLSPDDDDLDGKIVDCALTFCHLTASNEGYVLLNALSGLSLVLNAGQRANFGSINPYTQVLIDTGTIDRIVFLKDHYDLIVREKAREMLEMYFPPFI